MSLSWQQWCREQTNSILGITEREREALMKNIHMFCGIGDKMVKDQINPKENANDLFDKMPLEQKLEFTSQVLQLGFEILGLRKKKIQNEDEDNSITNSQGQKFLEQRTH